MSHDYKRNGTTTLFAAMDALDGNVLSKCMPRHRHQEFIRFLNQIDQQTPSDLTIHLILDNYGTHKAREGDTLVGEASAISLSLHSDEQFMAERRRAILPGSNNGSNSMRQFTSVPDLIAAIHDLHRCPQRGSATLYLDRRGRQDPREGRPRPGSAHKSRTA